MTDALHVDSDGMIYISATDPGEWEDLVVGVQFVLKGGGDYWCYSSPISVVRRTGDVDYSHDQLIIRKTPDRKGYDLGDKLDLTGLQDRGYVDLLFCHLYINSLHTVSVYHFLI